MSEPTPWHQLFGLTLVDFFHGSPIDVDLEVDLSLSRQLLDVLLIRPHGTILPRRMPDGFDDLAPYNLVTFKSYQDTLTAWSVLELIGHYVNYRKQTPAPDGELLPEDQFLLIAVVVRSPAGLREWPGVRQRSPGVYEVPVLDRVVRVVVIHELPEEPHNAPLHLFAARQRQVAYAIEHYQPFSATTSTLLTQLLARYGGEVPMAITMDELVRRTREELFEKATPEERQALLARLPLEERLAGVPVEKATPEERRALLARVPMEERLAGVPIEERLAGVPVEERLAGVPVEARLAGLTPEQRAALARLLQGDPPPR